MREKMRNMTYAYVIIVSSKTFIEKPREEKLMKEKSMM
jgi:hypothetical protein